jgi:hypothetical protein
MDALKASLEAKRREQKPAAAVEARRPPRAKGRAGGARKTAAKAR